MRLRQRRQGRLLSMLGALMRRRELLQGKLRKREGDRRRKCRLQLGRRLGLWWRLEGDRRRRLRMRLEQRQRATVRLRRRQHQSGLGQRRRLLRALGMIRGRWRVGQRRVM